MTYTQEEKIAVVEKAQQTGDWSEVLSTVKASQKKNSINNQRVNLMRTREKILRDVLYFCKRPIIQTNLCLKANISSCGMFRRYTDPLIERSLISLTLKKVRKTEREFFSLTVNGERALLLLDEHLETVPRGMNVLSNVLDYIETG